MKQEKTDITLVRNSEYETKALSGVWKPQIINAKDRFAICKCIQKIHPTPYPPLPLSPSMGLFFRSCGTFMGNAWPRKKKKNENARARPDVTTHSPSYPIPFPSTWYSTHSVLFRPHTCTPPKIKNQARLVGLKCVNRWIYVLFFCFGVKEKPVALSRIRSSPPYVWCILYILCCSCLSIRFADVRVRSRRIHSPTPSLWLTWKEDDRVILHLGPTKPIVGHNLLNRYTETSHDLLPIFDMSERTMVSPRTFL